jgi:hypothetical protein
MLAFSSRRPKKGGGSVQQPLQYLDPTMSGPSASAGRDMLYTTDVLARPRIPIVGGGSNEQSVQYVDLSVPTPSAPAGENLLTVSETIVRPRIGGFIPSVMKGVVNSGTVLVPLAAMAAHRMMNSTRKRGGAQKKAWKTLIRKVRKNKTNKKNHKMPTSKQINAYVLAVRKGKPIKRFLKTVKSK